MILANLENYSDYCHIHPDVRRILEYIRSADLSSLNPGRIVLDGNNLFINVDEPMLKAKDEQRLEFHRRYIDVQVPLLQPETIGWSDVNKLGMPDIPYDSDKDCGFFCHPADNYFVVNPGMFAIFFPTDAHAPIIGNGRQRKLVGKVLI